MVQKGSKIYTVTEEQNKQTEEASLDLTSQLPKAVPGGSESQVS